MLTFLCVVNRLVIPLFMEWQPTSGGFWKWPITGSVIIVREQEPLSLAWSEPSAVPFGAWSEPSAVYQWGRGISLYL